MTERQKFEANEKREELFKRDGYMCRNCFENIRRFGTPQIAHGISKSKNNLKKYGDEIINHPLNLFSVCSLKCNDAMAKGVKSSANYARYIRGKLNGE